MSNYIDDPGSRYGDPNDPFYDRRKKLISQLRQGGGMGGGPVHALGGARPMFGGMGRGSRSSFDLPMAALPHITFNPFLSQTNAGVPNLAPPTPNGGGPVAGPPVGAPPAPPPWVTASSPSSAAPPRWGLGYDPLAPPQPGQTTAADPNLKPLYGSPIANPAVIRLLAGF